MKKWTKIYTKNEVRNINEKVAKIIYKKVAWNKNETVVKNISKNVVKNINKRWSHRPTAPFAPGQGLPYSRDDLFLCFFSEMFRSCSRSVNVSRSGLSPRTVSPSVGARPPVETANASNELRRRRRCWIGACQTRWWWVWDEFSTRRAGVLSFSSGRERIKRGGCQVGPPLGVRWGHELTKLNGRAE